MTASSRLLLSVCFFVSGATGLMYEVVWSRYLQSLFGSTTEAVGVVLAVFMAGLGLGAHLLGGRIDRSPAPARLYAAFEVGIGLYALLTGPLLALVRAVYTVLARALPPSPAAALPLKALLAAIVLLPPALLMGATLPALVKAVSATAAEARVRLGFLYAVNTLGALAGTLAAGLVLIEALGLSLTMRLAAALNLTIGLLVFVASRGEREAAPHEPAAARFRETIRLLASSGAGRFALLALFISGATTMLYEVVFTRVLCVVFGVSTYAFTLVLAVFLLGLGLGALAYGVLFRRRVPSAAHFAATQVAVGVAGAVALFAMPAVPRLVAYARQIPEPSFAAGLALKALIAAVLLLPVAALAGLGLPILFGCVAGDLGRLGRVIGDAYLVNTVGTVAGSLAAGFVLIQTLGTERALLATVLLSLATGILGLLALAPGRALRSLPVALAALALITATAALAKARWPVAVFVSDTQVHPMFTTRLDFESFLAGGMDELMFFEEGRNATVAVMQSPGARRVLISGHVDASDTGDMGTQEMVAVVALLAHPAPEDVLVVGYGSGVTVDRAARFPSVRRVDCVEMEAAVLHASPLFHHINNAAERNPKVTLHVDDARSFVEVTPRRYDAVVSEPSNPWRAGVANVFTRDFYRSAQRVLKPGGVFAQWVQLYKLDFETVQLMLRTFAASFPEVQVWWIAPGNVVLLGGEQPIALDADRALRMLQGEFREDAARHAGLRYPGELFGRFMLGTAEVQELVGSGPIHTVSSPLLEFRAARGIYGNDPENTARLLYARLNEARRGGRALAPPVRNGPVPEAGVWLGLAELLRTAGRPAEALEVLTRARAAFPEPLLAIRAAALQLQAGDASAARRLLAEGPEAPPASDAAEEALLVQARLAAAEGRAEEALALYARVKDRDAVEVESLRILAQTGADAPVFEGAERILSRARLGGTLGANEVAFAYATLVQTVRRGADPLKALRLVTTLPDPAAGFPVKPRLRAMANLYESAGRVKDALRACEELQALGYFDDYILGLHERALAALNRLAEAREIHRRLISLVPRLEHSPWPGEPPEAPVIPPAIIQPSAPSVPPAALETPAPGDSR